MNRTHPRRPVPRAPWRLPAAAVLTLGALALAACGGQPTADSSDAVGQPAEGTVAYPLTLENCGHALTFDAPPERVLLLHSAPVTAFAALGILDRVTARAGAFPSAYYDADTEAALEEIPSLTEQVDASGHYEISEEAVIAEAPDLVMGATDGVTREGLADAGIPQLIVPSQCPGATDSPGFADVSDLVTSYGEIFDRPEAAAAYSAALAERVVEIDAATARETRTAAALYPTIGGAVGYAYGNVSMAHPQLEAAGFTNVFGEVDERVFEVSIEELLDRDPDVLVLLHIDGDPEEVEAHIRSLPGAETLTAVTDDALLTQLFNFSEPPTPLVIDGLAHIVEAFAE